MYCPFRDTKDSGRSSYVIVRCVLVHMYVTLSDS